jgi:glucose uptake protein GlcU
MDPTKLRLRHLVGILLAAVLTAALLRHVIHTYGGYTREQIRAVSIGAVIVVVLMIWFVISKRRE